MDILYEETNFEYKKRKYLKGCLKMATEVGCSTDRRNVEDILEYIDELERAVMDMDIKIKSINNNPLFTASRKDNGELIKGYFLKSGRDYYGKEKLMIVIDGDIDNYCGLKFIEVIPETIKLSVL